MPGATHSATRLNSAWCRLSFGLCSPSSLLDSASLVRASSSFGVPVETDQVALSAERFQDAGRVAGKAERAVDIRAARAHR